MKEKFSTSPPRPAQKILKLFLRDELHEEVQGDLEEQFQLNLKSKTAFRAKLTYWYEVLRYVRPFAIKKTTNLSFNMNMYQSYFKVGWRNLTKHKGYSLINIGGLALGMAVAILIGLWVNEELTYNQYHKNYDRIGMLMQHQTFEGEISTRSSQPMQLSPVLEEEYGNYFKYIITSSQTEKHFLSFQDKPIASSGRFMETEAPDLLSLEFIEGNQEGLKEINTILLSESTAYALFGDAAPLGQIIKIDNTWEVEVRGVYKDIPASSSFSELEYIAPWTLLVKIANLEERVGWGNNWFEIFVGLEDNVSFAQASAAIKTAKRDFTLQKEDNNFNPELFAFPMSKWYLYSDFDNGVNVGGRIEMVWLISIIGIFVLLLACINFMNLSTARSEKRAKEVGIRKAMGSVRVQLIHQFFSESVLTSFIAFVFSLLLVQMALATFNQIADAHITILYTSPWFWILGLGISLLTGLVSGMYPALFLSSFNPIKVLKGGVLLSRLQSGRYASLARKSMVIVQFTISIGLIIGTTAVYQQIQYAKNRPIGYHKEGVISIPLMTEKMRNSFETFRNELITKGTAHEVALSQSPITSTYTTNGGFEWKGKDPDMQDEIVTSAVNHEFGEVIQWQIQEGRDFSRAYATDTAGFILNETAVAYMGLENPIGEIVKAFGKEYTIIGVVKDMVTQSLYQPTKPMVFYIDTFQRNRLISIRTNPQLSASAALSQIEDSFKNLFPGTPFEYYFTDDEFAKKFSYEARIGKLSALFTALAILISCLGLFGLSAYLAEQRTKEIGIRKVLGASVASLWQLLSKDYVLLVGISILLASPLAYFFMQDWLQSYEYRTHIHWWIFALAGCSALLISILTVSFQTIKAALLNPVKSLKSE